MFFVTSPRLTRGTCRCRRDSSRSGQGGFTVVESMIAASILLILLAGFGRTIGTGFSGSRDNDVTQEATSIAVERLEFARSLSWSQLAMSGVDSGGPAVNQETRVLVASEAGIAEDEPLVVDEANGLIEHRSVESVDGTKFTAWTTVSETAEGHRRVLVVVEFRVEGAVSYHWNSTIVSEAATR